VSSSNQTPDPEVPARAKSRTYSAVYKARVLTEYESLDKAIHQCTSWRTDYYGACVAIAWRLTCRVR
jgi:hypothetical protein